jgi:hypothetical protein
MFITKRIWKPFVAMQECIRAKKERDRLNSNTWQGLIPGDVIQYKVKSLMYLGMSKELRMEGPGGFGFNEPVFVEPITKPPCVYYIRTGRDLPEAFSEDAAPAKMGSTGIRVGFLNSDPALRPELFRKTVHISADEWEQMQPHSEPLQK